MCLPPEDPGAVAARTAEPPDVTGGRLRLVMKESIQASCSGEKGGGSVVGAEVAPDEEVWSPTLDRRMPDWWQSWQLLMRKIPHFMAYLKTITHASRNFDGVAWASYDAAYRRQAAACSFYDWATIDSALYNEAFTGRARIMPRCRYCLSETHQSTDCAYAPSEETPHTHQPKIPRTTLPPSSFSRTPQDRPGSSGGVELCGLYNRTEGNQCNYKFCRYAHICSKCRTGPHPAADCGKQGTIRPPRSRPSYDKTLRQPPPATSQ